MTAGKVIYKKKNSGISLAETIVAMALITIMSLIAFSTCSLSLTINNNSKVKNFFMVEANNYIDCYYMGSADYTQNMNFLTGENYTYGQNASIYYSKDLQITTEQNAKYYVNLSYGSQFLVECYNISNDLIYSVGV